MSSIIVMVDSDVYVYSSKFEAEGNIEYQDVENSDVRCWDIDGREMDIIVKMNTFEKKKSL